MVFGHLWYGANPNYTKTVNEDSKAFINNPQIQINDYLLQKSNMGHCRLVKDGKRTAHGCEELFVSTIYNKALERKIINNLSNKELGIVFSGGAARGAYEIGVWKALIELDLANKVTGISGTSVGALNALLFAQGDYDAAANVWEQVQKRDLIKPRFRLKEKSINTLQQNTERAKTPDEVVTNLYDWIRQFSISLIDNNVPKLIDQSIKDYSFMTNKLIYTCLSLRGWPVFQNADNELDPEWHREWYVPLNILDNTDLKTIVTASTRIPVVYPKSSINHMSFVDGGVTDNTPVKPLLNAGFKKIIVVHLDNRQYQECNIIHKENSTVYNIVPSGDLKGYLSIDRGLTLGRREMGYEDTIRFLGFFLERGMI
ncbi:MULTISPECIES: patatin-like phospholipase family protein [unclassified Butyrivibrio]|uniref:patatin-like phospholipase family protein n=1 Tax=unclassified Butyrivibrio TaxID=2639466 RepID=UPI00040A8D92|nr:MULTISPECIES: patatin-like phospholipase family protein [unclassified Butyrivibrio]